MGREREREALSPCPPAQTPCLEAKHQPPSAFSVLEVMPGTLAREDICLLTPQGALIPYKDLAGSPVPAGSQAHLAPHRHRPWENPVSTQGEGSSQGTRVSGVKAVGLWRSRLPCSSVLLPLPVPHLRQWTVPTRWGGGAGQQAGRRGSGSPQEAHSPVATVSRPPQPAWVPPLRIRARSVHPDPWAVPRPVFRRPGRGPSLWCLKRGHFL